MSQSYPEARYPSIGNRARRQAVSPRTARVVARPDNRQVAKVVVATVLETLVVLATVAAILGLGAEASVGTTAGASTHWSSPVPSAAPTPAPEPSYWLPLAGD
jgi:hypothetical protein